MSTKIYNGFRLKGVRTLDKAFFMMPELRKPIRAAAELQAAKLLVMRASYIYDEATYLGEKQGMSALKKAYGDIWAGLRESARTRERDYFDLGFDLSLAVTTDKNVIGMAFGNNDIKKAFFALEPVADYSYWDNTDEPDDVTPKDWAKRRGHWNEVLGVSSVPAQSMFNITFVPEYEFPYPDRELVAQQSITFERRLQKLGEAITIARAKEELKLDTTGAVIQFMMQKSAFKPRLEAVIEEIKDKLQPTLTLEELQETI